jgi:hypothetical protein
MISNTSIDWAKMPRGTKIEHDDMPAFFSEYSARGLKISSVKWANGKFAPNRTVSAEFVQLIQGDWVPWFGGECPVPEGIRFSAAVFYQRPDGIVDRYVIGGVSGDNTNWSYAGHIIAYRIEGIEEGWSV